jgi:hypothetical protein
LKSVSYNFSRWTKVLIQPIFSGIRIDRGGEKSC